MILKLVLKLGWILLGSISFVGGIIGMLLPVIPQVPFFLLTIWCITKISPRFHNWLLRNPLYIKYAKPLVNRLENLKHYPKQKAQKINTNFKIIKSSSFLSYYRYYYSIMSV